MPNEKDWREAIAELESLYFQLANNIMSPDEREMLALTLRAKLFKLARRDFT